MTGSSFRRGFLILLVVIISMAFLMMVQVFLLTILLAALFTGVSYPLYKRLLAWTRGRSTLAAVATLLVLLALVVGPLLAVLGAVATEASRVNETILPAIQRMIAEPGEFDRRLRPLPGYDRIAPYRTEILSKASELIGSAGIFMFNALSATTKATVVFVFHFVVMLYTMFFFLTDGPRIVRSILEYLPVADLDKENMLQQFVSVTRATLKGTVLIGLAQGLLGGLAFWAVGIQGAIFWGTVMIVLSIIPGIGAALVWVPAALLLIGMGHIWQGVLLALFCALVVGSVDNILRPILVGRDTQMHELMIFFSTLGGILLFGAMGFILGPILAALFMTIWEMFRLMFRRELADAAGNVVIAAGPADPPSPVMIIEG